MLMSLLYMVELGEKELKDEAFFERIRAAKNTRIASPQ